MSAMAYKTSIRHGARAARAQPRCGRAVRTGRRCCTVDDAGAGGPDASRRSASTSASPACRRPRPTSTPWRTHRSAAGQRAGRGGDRHRRSPRFYNVTLKNIVTPWTNRDQTVFVPLNDYTATVIGMVRDDVPFNTALSGRHSLYDQCARAAGAVGRQQQSLRDGRAPTAWI